MNTIIPLALTSGINLYLTMLIIGLSIRFGWVTDAPPGLDVFATLPVLIIVGFFYILEFFADKIAFVDNLWDLLHTFIRPIGAIIIATASLSGLDADVVGATASLTGVSPETSFFAALLAGGTALVAHGGKAGTRTAVNVTSPAETFTNIAISLAEDVLVAMLVFLALRYPVAANVLAIGILVAILVFVPQLLRWTWFTLRAVLAALKGVVQKVDQSDSLPPEYQALLGEQTPMLVSRSQAQNIRQANGRRGYLVLTDASLGFVYRAWFRPWIWQITVDRIESVSSRRRALMDVLEVTYADKGTQSRVVRFAFTKDREPLMEQFAERLGMAQEIGV